MRIQSFSIQSAVSCPLLASRLFALIALWFVPISTAITNAALLMSVLTALFAPEPWHRWRVVMQHTVSLAAMALAAALIFSLFYSTAPLADGIRWLIKFRKLLFIPFLILIFQQSDWANAARTGLFISLIIVLLLSTANYFDLTAVGPLYQADNPLMHAWVFKNRITAGLFSALLFSLSADLAYATQRKSIKVIFYLIALLALANVVIMLQGRTGQIILVFLVIYQFARVMIQLYRMHPHPSKAHYGWLIVPCLLISGSFIYLKSDRLFQINSEIQAYQQYNEPTSVGLRLEWSRKSLKLFSKRPFFGYGAAGVQQEFKTLAEGYEGAHGVLTKNPHNQYLLLAVELGLVGVGLFIHLLVQVARAAWRLPTPSRQLLGAWLFMFSLGCFANSLLLDFSEGYLFVLLTGILLGCAHPPTRPIVRASQHDQSRPLISPQGD
jgi:O-antigen ligase